jgi:hypothetical protein
MANESVTVFESDGVTEKVVKTLDFGRQAAAASKSLALSNEDKTALDALVTDLAALEVLITDVKAATEACEVALEAIQLIQEDPDPVDVALSASTAHIGQVGAPVVWVEVAFTLDASLHASGEVLADTQAMAGAVRVNAGAGRIDEIVILDEDDLGLALDIVFLSANTSIGTESGALGISDADAREILGIVSVVAGDYVDMGGMRVATLRNVGQMIKGAAASTSCYVALITRATPTPTAGGLRGRFAIAQA